MEAESSRKGIGMETPQTNITQMYKRLENRLKR